MSAADLVISGGPILTLDPAFPQPEAVAVRDGTIVAVGSRDELLRERDRRTETLDLAGDTLIPGFYDAHQHQLYAGLATEDVDGRAGSVEELVARVAAAAARAGGGGVVGGGWDEGRLAERRTPTRADLDRAAPEHPAFITRTCGHAMAVNSLALALAGIDARTPDPPGGRIERDERGEPSGVVHETAMELIRRVVPLPSRERHRRVILAAAAANLRHGITSVWEPSVEPDHVAAYRELAAEGLLPVRVTMAHKKVLRSGEIMNLPEPFRGEWLSLVAVKLFQDGAIAPRTAALGSPYEGEPDNRGVLRWPQDELDEHVRAIHRAGLIASIHAIGDAAIASALDAIDLAQRSERPQPLRHRIEHCGLPLGELPDRVRASRAIPVVQTPFVHFHGDNYMRNLGPERSLRLYPTRTLLERVGVVAGSSDGPVVPDLSPLLGMRAAMTRLSASGRPVATGEAISFGQALYLYTLGAAAAAGEQEVKGAITPGKYADFAVLSGDLAAPELDGVQVARTIVAGRADGDAPELGAETFVPHSRMRPQRPRVPSSPPRSP
jgi:predicted amidohydrolase YtcJ